jgi:hypothetical protein
VWRAVRYFGFRYGERGRAFGLSDEAWLVTLAASPRDERIAQIEWLAGLLSPRGIPSWLVEAQFRATARIGTRSGWPGAEAFSDAARHLGGRRRSVLSEESFQLAGRRFCQIAGRSRLADGTGKMVASAEIDVALGFSQSSASLEEWFRSTGTFPRCWLEAIERTRVTVALAIGRPPTN